MNEEVKNIVIIGAGIAGMESASNLSQMGYNVDVIEKNSITGGHVRLWKKTFPYLENAKIVNDFVSVALKSNNIRIHTNTEITYAEKQENRWKLISDKNKHFFADAVLLTPGFDVFDAHKKEEYGYGIFENVITNKELEDYFNNSFSNINKSPKKFGFIHCVGSRDAKSGNKYCSKVCCATAVKQAIEVKEFFPDAEVYCFYMDLRMFGKNYEELYQKAQEKYGIHFIRARLSEVNQNIDNSLLIKVEDTLTSKPMKLSLDYIVLMCGMEPNKSISSLSKIFKISIDENGFINPLKNIIGENNTEKEGLFLAGACTGPKTIIDTISDSRSATLNIHHFLKNNSISKRKELISNE